MLDKHVIENVLSRLAVGVSPPAVDLEACAQVSEPPNSNSGVV